MSTAPFPELASESVAISWVENRPDGGLGAEKESMVSLYGPWRRKSPKVSSVKEWWWMGQEGGKVEPTQVDARRVRGLHFVGGEERMVVVGWKGRETSPSKPIPGIDRSHSLRGR